MNFSLRVVRALVFPTVAIVAMACLACSARAAEPETSGQGDEPMGDVTLLPALDATAGRVEDFGFRVSPAYDPARTFLLKRAYTPVVDVVLPNTAADRAGLRPGDRIVQSDGAATASGTFSLKKWRSIQEAKWAAIARGAKNVTWTLQVEEPVKRQLRTVTLTIPTPAPRWGGSVWQRPERPPAAVPEPGPLAERAREVLDNGIWILLRRSYVRGLQMPVSEQQPYFLCHQWTLWSGAAGHRIYVSQQRGRTDIILEAISAESAADLSRNASTDAPVPKLASATTVFARESRAYLTSPSGALERAWMLSGSGPQQELPLEAARAEFQREMDFWLNQVGPARRWPLVVLAPERPTDAPADSPPAGVAQNPAPAPAAGIAVERVKAFRQLPRARPDQVALFEEAFAKIGAEQDRWAYTEATRRFGEKRPSVVVRVDPSKPEAERCTLLTVDGKPPGADELHRWQDAGTYERDPLGELRNIREIVDRTDVRVFAEERAATVFELPVAAEARAAGLPAEQVQALFRVNRTTRALEDIIVKMREPVRVAAGVKLAEAGLEARFSTLDPAFPPQPVRLRGGGAVRVLLVKIARDFETTRTDFKRVEPYPESE